MKKLNLYLTGMAIVGMSVAYIIYSRQETAKKIIEVTISSPHKAASIFVAFVDNLNNSDQQHVTKNKDWKPIKLGKNKFPEGGIYYKIEIKDKISRFGLISVNETTKKIILR